jgi:hypothetical protein
MTGSAPMMAECSNGLPALPGIRSTALVGPYCLNLWLRMCHRRIVVAHSGQ